MENNRQAARESTLKDFLEVIFRRKWIIIGVVAVATAMVVYLNLRQPGVFESSGRILVRRGEASGVFSTYVRTLSWEEEIASQIEMVKSQGVVERAGEIVGGYLPEGYSTDEEIHLSRIDAGVVSTSNVLWVTYSSQDPVFCRASVDAIINAYQSYFSEIRTPPEMEDFFSREITRMKEELEYWRNRKATLESDWGIIDVEHQRRGTINRIDRYRTQLEEIQQEKEELEALISSIERYSKLPIEEQAAQSNFLFRDARGETSLQQLTGRLRDLKIRESEMMAAFTPENRELKMIRAQIEDIYSLMELEMESMLSVKRSELDILLRREQTLLGLLAELESVRTVFPVREVELQRVNSALASVQERYDELMERHMSAKISLASNPEWTVTVISPASPAYRKKTRDYVRMALGPLFSLIVALGFAFFIDNLDHSIKNVSEAEEMLGFQVLASFPDTER